MVSEIESIKEKIKDLINKGYLEESKDILQIAKAKIGQDADLLSMESVILILQDKLVEAKRHLLESIEHFPLGQDLLFNIAYIYEKEGKYQEAYSYYRDVQRLGDAEVTTAASMAIEQIKRHFIPVDKENLIFFCKKGLNNFLTDIIKVLSKQYRVKTVIVTKLEEIEKGIKLADICWFEWCDELIIHATNNLNLKNKYIVCRLHRYEAFTQYIHQVKWEVVDKVIFVAEHIKDYVVQSVNILHNKQVIIPNGIDVNKFILDKQKKRGYNIAYVGYLNYKKGPMLLLQTFKALFDIDDNYKLYIAGEFQDAIFELYFKQMIIALELEHAIVFEGWQEDIEGWLSDKHYILSTSAHEGHPVGVMEAMAKGLKPLIHNYVGAKEQFGKYVWNTIHEAVEMVLSTNYNPVEYASFIVENYSLSIQIGRIVDVFNEFNKELTGSSLQIDETTNVASKEEVVEFYNNFLPYLKNDRKKENPRHAHIKSRLSQIISSGHKVLDLGCGIGITTEYISTLGVNEVIGVDLSPELINYARETVPNVDFFVGDITSIEVDKKFDVITLCDVMEHVPREKYQKLFENITKHLEKDGKLYISIPDSDYLDYVRQKNPSKLQIIDNSITLNEVQELCNTFNLNIAFYNIYGIDVNNQYNEYLLTNKKVKHWSIFG